jgi:hypothetical protein
MKSQNQKGRVSDVPSEYLLISVMLKVVGVKNTKYLGVEG